MGSWPMDPHAAGHIFTTGTTGRILSFVVPDIKYRPCSQNGSRAMIEVTTAQES
jgi:hypothetical protein